MVQVSSQNFIHIYEINIFLSDFFITKVIKNCENWLMDNCHLGYIISFFFKKKPIALIEMIYLRIIYETF